MNAPETSLFRPDPPPATWRLEITARPEPLLLARVLQKLAVPEIELLAAHYVAGDDSGAARAVLRFVATAPRARLAAVRTAKLLAAVSVGLTQGPEDRCRGTAGPA